MRRIRGHLTYANVTATLAPRGAQVTPSGAGDGQISAFLTIGGTAACPAPGVEVETYDGAPPPRPSTSRSTGNP